MYPTLTSSARSSIRSFLMKRTSFERSANRLRGYHPCCLSLLYHILETLSIKNFNDAVFGVVFYVLALIQTAGRGIHYLSAFPAASPWRQLSPADKLQHRESRPRLSVFILLYPEARRASPFLSFRFPSRGFGALFPAPPRIPSINNSFLHTIIYRYYCPKNVIGCRSLFVTFSVSFSSPANCLF